MRTTLDPSNYRPVSLISQVCKILERIIRDSIVEQLETSNLIDNSQHGFRNHKSCLTNLVEFLDDVMIMWIKEFQRTLYIWIFKKPLIRFLIGD